jgi:hypothetical protein
VSRAFLNLEQKNRFSAEIWKKIEDRKDLKQEILNSKSVRIQEPLRSFYNIKNKEVKRSDRKYRPERVNAKAREAEEAAGKEETRIVYKITN